MPGADSVKKSFGKSEIEAMGKICITNTDAPHRMVREVAMFPAWYCKSRRSDARERNKLWPMSPDIPTMDHWIAP